jgi:hypothetical protein
MGRIRTYDGKGTIIGFSLDGLYFTNLPPMDKFQPLPGGVAARDELACLDAQSVIDLPTVLENNRYLGNWQGRVDQSFEAVRSYHQNANIVHFRVTAVDGSTLVAKKCLIEGLEFNPPRFSLVIKEI